MMRKILIAVVAVSALILVLLPMRRSEPEPPFEDTALFNETTNIVFKEQPFPTDKSPAPERRQFTIATSNEVSHFVSVIRLQRKLPCPCPPHFEAFFQQPSGEIHVSFCDHCFDLLAGTDVAADYGAQSYRMPKNFYATFRQIAQDREHWIVPE